MRKKLFLLLEQFNKKLAIFTPAGARAVIVLGLGLLAGMAKCRGKNLLAYMLLGVGISVSLGAFTFVPDRRCKGKK